MRHLIAGAALAALCWGCQGSATAPLITAPGIASGSPAPGASATANAAVAPPAAAGSGAAPAVPASAPGAPPAGPANAAASAPASSALAARRFASALYGELASRTDDDLVVSPWSAWIALSMTALGASDANQGAALGLLRVDGLTRPHTQIGALLRQLEADASGSITWRNANRVYVDQASEASLNAAFVRQLAEAYAGTVGLSPFATDPEAARRAINSWVADQTEQRIAELLAQGIITPATAMVLVNAVYFLAPWQVEFDAALTRDAEFRTPTGPVQVPTMHRTATLQVAEAEGVVAVRLPYVGGAFEMVVVIPVDDGLAAAERLITAGDALGPGGALAEFGAQQVRFALPRFTLRTSGSLMDPLRRIGLDAVEQAGPFDRLLVDDPLSISEVIQEAFIEVTEQGTEAAAATAVVMTRGGSAAPRIRDIRADRPFVAVVRHVASGTPLFIARVTDPR